MVQYVHPHKIYGIWLQLFLWWVPLTVSVDSSIPDDEILRLDPYGVSIMVFSSFLLSVVCGRTLLVSHKDHRNYFNLPAGTLWVFIYPLQYRWHPFYHQWYLIYLFCVRCGLYQQQLQVYFTTIWFRVICNGHPTFMDPSCLLPAYYSGT